MLSDRAKDARDGIRFDIEAIRNFVEGKTVEKFASDLLTFHAVTKALEIISEASRRLPDDLKARHTEVRWGAVHASGNVYRHSYSQVSAALVWDTATTQLDALWKVAIEEMAADQEEAKAHVVRERGPDESSQS